MAMVAVFLVAGTGLGIRFTSPGQAELFAQNPWFVVQFDEAIDTTCFRPDSGYVTLLSDSLGTVGYTPRFTYLDRVVFLQPAVIFPDSDSVWVTLRQGIHSTTNDSLPGDTTVFFTTRVNPDSVPASFTSKSLDPDTAFIPGYDSTVVLGEIEDNDSWAGKTPIVWAGYSVDTAVSWSEASLLWPVDGAMDSSAEQVQNTERSLDTLSVGTHIFYLYALDNCGNLNQDSLTLWVIQRPQVDSTDPYDGEFMISVSTDILVWFSENIDQNTIGDSAVRIRGSQTGLHGFTFIYSSGPRLLTLNPSVNFSPQETVFVDLTDRIKGFSNNPLFPYSFWFMTSPSDTGAFTISYDLEPDTAMLGVNITVHLLSSRNLSQVACSLYLDTATLEIQLASLSPKEFQGTIRTGGLPTGTWDTRVWATDEYGSTVDTSARLTLLRGNLLSPDSTYVWPDPVDGDQANFRFWLGENAQVSLSVFTLGGKKLLFQTVAGEGGKWNTVVVDVSRYGTDIYYYKVSALNGMGVRADVTKKFTVVK